MWLTACKGHSYYSDNRANLESLRICKKNWKFICWVLLICPQIQYFSKKLPHSYSLPLFLMAQKYYIVNLLSSKCVLHLFKLQHVFGNSATVEILVLHYWEILMHCVLTVRKISEVPPKFSRNKQFNTTCHYRPINKYYRMATTASK